MSANIITFDSQYIADQMRGIDKARSLVEEAMTLIKNASKHRNWQCNESTEIDNSLQTIANRLNRLNMGIIQTGNALGKGLVSFTELEERATTQAGSMATNLKNKYGFEASHYGQDGSTTLPVTQIPYDKNSVSIVKTGLSWLDKANISDDVSDRAGLGKDFLSYLESLHKFIKGDKRGLTGAEDLFDLADNSVGLYSSFYEYLKDENIFSKGLGIASSSLGLISSGFGVIDKITSGDLGPAGITSEIIGLGSNGLNMWESIEKLKHLGEEATNITTKAGKTGLYSPLNLWLTFGETAIATGSQMFKSIDKYSADGKWDLGDTGRTGIESGVAGLYTMFDKLSLGGLSTLGDVTGFTPENISADIENWADGVGKAAGNYIVNNSGLYQAYNNAGPIGKTAITFHAAIQSGIQSTVEGVGNWFQSLFS